MCSTPNLDKISSFKDLKGLNGEKLQKISKEIREELIENISRTGGHLGANLGVVDLTLALYSIFDLDVDKVIWDVSHQSYTHKILTNRRDKIKSIRTTGGISGYCCQSESKYDFFGAGHASTAISAALGFVHANKLRGNIDNKVIAIVGDGALSGGLSFEGLNNSHNAGSNLIVVLNDNEMSIDKATGGISLHLTDILSSNRVNNMKNFAKGVIKFLPPNIQSVASKVDRLAKDIVSNDVFFGHLGFQYFGPIDGHDYEQMLHFFKKTKDIKSDNPILLHVVTKKGYQYEPAERAKDKLHGVGKFNIETGKSLASGSSSLKKSYTSIFSHIITKRAKEDKDIIAITAAMGSGVGLENFAKLYPQRFFDVGIAEGHAVTFAAGLSSSGLKPVVAIYSTFLQRAYDSIIHDVAVQNLPMLFAIDRAGLVGADGKTHGGIFDLTMLCNIPNLKVIAPSSGQEFVGMLNFVFKNLNAPIALRYPRGASDLLDFKNDEEKINPFEANIVNSGESIAFLSLGNALSQVLKAKDILHKEYDINPTVVDCRSAKPIDSEITRFIMNEYQFIVIVEYGATGGFGAQILKYVTDNNLVTGEHRIKSITLPDRFIEHATTQEEQYSIAQLDSVSIVKKTLELCASY